MVILGYGRRHKLSTTESAPVTYSVGLDRNGEYRGDQARYESKCAPKVAPNVGVHDEIIRGAVGRPIFLKMVRELTETRFGTYLHPTDEDS